MESRRLYYEWLMIKTEIILWMMNDEGGRQRQENNKKNLLFKARKQLRNLLQNAALHTSDGSENERATNGKIVSSEYLPVYKYEWNEHVVMNEETEKQKTYYEWWMMKAEDHIMNEESRIRSYNEWKVEDCIMND